MLYIQYSWLGIAHRTCVLRLSGKGIRLLGLDKKMGELGTSNDTGNGKYNGNSKDKYRDPSLRSG
jgi:hypothetical protein